MKNLWIASLCLLSAAGGHAAVPTPAPMLTPVPAAPKPGRLETYKDWTIGCDNRTRCEAVALQPENADWSDDAIVLSIARNAGPDAQAEVRIDHQAIKGNGAISIFIDDRKVASVASDGDAAQVRGPQAAALAIAMARGGAMDLRTGGRVIGRPSLVGSAAALRYMDARQGRAGTITALIATGPLGPGAVRPVPPTIRITRATVPNGAAPPALWRQERITVDQLTRCAKENRNDVEPDLHRLSHTETLVILPCGSGAYNALSVPLIATGVPGRRAFRYARFDFPPGWSKDAAKPLLVNASFAAEASQLGSYAKGRGLGDCGGSEGYVWDGTRFRLVEARAMDECRGSWHWITTWSAQSVE